MGGTSKKSLNGAMGCLLAFLFPFAVMFAVVGFVWPVGSVLDLGEWMLSVSRKGHTFTFKDEYRQLGWLIAAFFVAQTLVLTFVQRRVFRKPPVASKYREFPEVEKTAESWEERLREERSAWMLDYESALEADLRRQQRPFWAGGCLVNLTPILANFTVDLFGSVLDPGPSDSRLFILLGFYSLGVALLIYGVRVKSAQPIIDDRVLFDFKAKEVQRVALHDPSREPERWFGFEDIQHLSYKKVANSEGTGCHGSLALVTETERLDLFTRSPGDWLVLGERIAERFSTTVRNC